VINCRTICAGAVICALVFCLQQVKDSEAKELPADLVLNQPLASGSTWTIRDIVEVRRITDIAVDEDARRAAFIVRQPIVATGAVQFGLYVVNLEGPADVRRILKASYLADLSCRPKTSSWTVRGDFGEGVQLYDIEDDGTRRALIVNERTAPVGTWRGLHAGLDLPHRAGVLSYQWAPDGSALWYSRFRLRDDKALSAYVNRGIVYDDVSMTALSPDNHPGLLLGTELRLLKMSNRADSLVHFAPTDSGSDLGLFSRKWETVGWDADSRRLTYEIPVRTSDGGSALSLWRVDTSAEILQAERLPLMSDALRRLVAVPHKMRYLAVLPENDVNKLVELDDLGRSVVQHGNVPYIGLKGNNESWVDSDTGTQVLAVRFDNRDGLTTVPSSPIGRKLEQIAESLSECEVVTRRDIAVCAAESLTVAPAVLRISLVDGGQEKLVDVNERYRSIVPLRTEYASWINRFGHRSDGYITYPRSLNSEQKHPAVVVTHGNDARNVFASEEFQWSFPVQVLAELGYFVLSVNEPRATSRERALFHERLEQATQSGPRKVQFDLGFDAVASMEAAVQSLIRLNLVDSEKVAITGYSRGAEIVVYALSQSTQFRSGVTGDGGAAVSGYWLSRMGRAWNVALYGGSPFSRDPAIIENYRRFSPSFRVADFTGPLLQLSPAATTLGTYELNSLLQEAGVPTEMVFFPDESHILWHPQRRAAAMERTMDWLNYWLLDVRSADISKEDQYRRWDTMRRRWDRRASPTLQPRESHSATALPKSLQPSR
jgi:predicted esterase